MAKQIKTRKGKDGFNYPYTSPDLVIDNTGKSATTRFEEIEDNQLNLIEDGTTKGIKDTEYDTLTTTNKTVIGSINELSTQYKDIANNYIKKENNKELISTSTNNKITNLLNTREIKHYDEIKLDWEVGGINGSNGKDTEDGTDRIRTSFYKFRYNKLKYNIQNGYRLLIMGFNKNTIETPVSQIGYLTGEGLQEINSNLYYRFVLREVTASGKIFTSNDGENVSLNQYIDDDLMLTKHTLYSSLLLNYNIPNYWIGTIQKKEKQIKDIIINATKNNETINLFFTSTDNHYPINNYVSADLMSYLSEKCGISMSLCLGDLITDSTIGHEDGLNRLQDAMAQLQRMSNVLLITQGNHDNNCGIKDSKGKLNSERIIYDSEWVLHTSNKLDINNINFYSNGKAFYYDDKLQKIRFISIDSFENKSYTINDGNVDNFNLGQPSDDQINWIRDVALNNIPNNYSVVSFSHLSLIPIYANNGTTDVNLNVGGMGNSTSITKVFKDFKANGGEYIGHFSGHVHHDFMNNQAGFYCIQTLNDGTHWRKASYFAGNEFVGDAPKKIAGTTNECAFDVVVINRTTHKVNLIRIGAGEDREFTY